MRSGFPFAAAVALFALTAGNPTTAPAAPSTNRMQMAKQFKFQKLQPLEVNYLLFLPQDYEAKSQKRWPLILFLHGAGERGTDVWKVATHGPPKNVSTQPDFPFLVVSPQCPEGQDWSKD